MEVKHDLARCIDAFREDLRQLLWRAIDGQVSAALEKATARRAASEQAASLREKKARRKQESLALKLRRLEKTQQGAGARRGRRRGRSALLEENGSAGTASRQGESQTPAPAPLFVHKRLRTGEIRELTRNQNGTPEP
ncbi:MAG TPA: hypothetical protein VF989_09490 [Polyangiaceae bacterium]|jgi:hypothetical protein